MNDQHLCSNLRESVIVLQNYVKEEKKRVFFLIECVIAYIYFTYRVVTY